MKSEAELARNTAMPARSSIVPQRPAGVRRSTFSSSPGDLLTGASREIGIDPARQHGIDLDIVARPGASDRFRELYDAAFARRIGGYERGSKDRHHRSDVDDLAGAV